ncbi:MAG: efflux RND transporter periplasmic adaptor subunit [Bythopirellula sp.]|nr:efflux RND transporter periplasmic adaptor subunit [Bythopirellula sp.]
MPPVESPSATPAGGKKLDLRGELSSLKIDRSQPRKTSLLGRLVWIVLGLVVLAGIGGGGYWALRDRLFPLPVVKVEMARIMTKGQVSAQLTATGYLESRWQAAVGAKVPGRIANIPVEEGDKVKAGDVLAELEHSDLDAMLASRKVAVSLAQAQVSEADYTLAQSERNMNRQRQLLERDAGTVEAVEQAETAYQVAQATQQARVAALDAAKSNVTEAEEAVKNMFIYAPFDGTVVTKDAEQGESIMPGGMGASSGRGSVITLAKLDELEVDTDVKEDYLGALRKGQPAQVIVDAVPNHRYKGKLREIIPMGDRTRGIVKVKVQILDPDERLFPELSATVLFLPDAPAGTAENNQAQEKGVFIPLAAIQEADEEKFVWLLEQDRVRKQAITTAGEANEGLIEIKTGLAGAERVIIAPPPGLQEGEQVQVQE